MDYESNCEGNAKTYGEDGKFTICIFSLIRTNCIIVSVLFSPIRITTQIMVNGPDGSG